MLFCDSLSDTGYRTGLECYSVLRLSFVSRRPFLYPDYSINGHIVTGSSVGIGYFAATEYPSYPRHLFDTEYNAAATGYIFRCDVVTSKAHIQSLCDKRILSWV